LVTLTAARYNYNGNWGSSAGGTQRFEREAKTICNLNLPNIYVLHDVGHQDGIDFLVMECIEGETLKVAGQNRQEKDFT
jgi:serine/threonine protein kinase